jgi:hypothetical protein
LSISQENWLDSFNEGIGDVIVELLSKLKEVTNNVHFSPHDLQDAYEKIPVLTKTVILKLHSLGWYSYWLWEWSGKDVLKINEMAVADNVAGIDQFMCEYIGSNIDSIQERLSSRYPARYRILESAFDAHREAKYALSIPVFLAQVEGLCVELFYFAIKLILLIHGQLVKLSIASGLAAIFDNPCSACSVAASSESKTLLAK